MPRKKTKRGRKKKIIKEPFLNKIIPKILMFTFIIVACVQAVNVVFITSAPEYVHAADEIKLNVPIGEYGTAENTVKFDGSTAPIAEYIKVVYQYATGAVGIIAAVVLMWGGVIWITSAGNNSRVGEAKAWIGAALTGLVLVMGSYMILYQINPDLVFLSSMDIGSPSDILTKNGVAEGKSACSWKDLSALPLNNRTCSALDTNLMTKDGCTEPRPEGEGYFCCCPPKPTECLENLWPNHCHECDNCTFLSIETKNGQQLNYKMAEKLSKVSQKIKQINELTNKKTIDNVVVTEAWPPTVKHASDCHYSGNCVDLNLKSKSTKPEDVAKVYQMVKNEGLSPVYECKTSGCCNKYNNVNVNVGSGDFKVNVKCITVPYITAPHFSVY